MGVQIEQTCGTQRMDEYFDIIPLELTFEENNSTFVRAAPGFAPKEQVNGKGGAHVTEKAALKDKIYPGVIDSLPSLSGKCICITGTTSGTGVSRAGEFTNQPV